MISTLIALGLLVWQAILFHGYSKVCKAVIDSGDDRDIELACLQQMRLVRFFGILMLIIFVSGGLGFLTAIVAGNGR